MQLLLADTSSIRETNNNAIVKVSTLAIFALTNQAAQYNQHTLICYLNIQFWRMSIIGENIVHEHSVAQ